MKNRIVIFILLAVFFSLLPACQPKIETNKGEQELALFIAPDTVVLSQKEGADQAISIVWTSGTNHGTGSAISYTLQIDTIGNEFAAGICWEIGCTSSRTLSFSHIEWQDTLLAYFPNIPLEDYSTLEARMTATLLMTGEVQVSPVISFVVRPYIERPQALYMVGDATPNGWDAQRATFMTQDATNFSVFTYEGVLQRGEFKFLLNPGQWLPCYVRCEEDSARMIYRENEEDYPDFKWKIEKKADYFIRVNLDSLTISVTNLGGDYPEPIFYAIYMIGDATPGGWSWDAVVQLTQDEEDINHFSYTGSLYEGEIKFPTEIVHDWSGEFLLAPEPNCEPTIDGTYVVGNQPDNKWKIPSAGTWQIDIHADEQTISFQQL